MASGAFVETKDGGTEVRQPTPYHDEDGVSTGWYELNDHCGWYFKSQRRPPRALKTLHSVLDSPAAAGFPAPERVFADSFLEVKFPEASGLSLYFCAADALQTYCSEQLRLCVDESGKLNPRIYDPLYRHEFRGTVGSDRSMLRATVTRARLIETPSGYCKPVRSAMKIPLDKLSVKGHIHFYDCVELFEDDLDGRGQVRASVKIRVMKDCFLVLLRSVAVVYGKAVWMQDTRYYHEFGKPLVLSDTEVRKGSMEELRKASEGSRPFSASVSDKARRDEDFFVQPDNIYDLLEPKSVLREQISLSLR